MSNDNLENQVETAEGTAEVNATAEQQEQNQEIDVNALMARLEKLESTNDRLLNESKQYKSKYRNLASEVEQKQKQDLEASESYKELLDMEKNRAFELEEENKKIRQTVLREKLNFEVAKHASDAHNIDHIINALPKELINIDSENMTIDGIELAVNKVREDAKYLFKSGVKNHGMSTEPPEGYKPETKEPTLAELLIQGSKEGII